MMRHSSKNTPYDIQAEPHSPLGDAATRAEPEWPTDGLMADMIFKLRVNQLASTLRMQGLDAEAKTMLGVLESLVIAGEIPFLDFMQRVQNLFPDVFDQIDTSLRDNLLRMLRD